MALCREPVIGGVAQLAWLRLIQNFKFKSRLYEKAFDKKVIEGFIFIKFPFVNRSTQ